MGKLILNQVNNINEAVKQLSIRPKNIFDKNIIVYQNAAVKDLVTYQIATQQKVSANLHFFTMHQLIELLSDQLALEPSRYALTWMIYELLDIEAIEDQDLKNYILDADDPSKVDEIKKLQLAKVTAELFDDYFNFKLETDKLHGWQKELWDKLDKAAFPGKKTEEIINVLKNQNTLKTSAIKIVGVEHFTPIHLDLLEELKNHIDIELFFVIQYPFSENTVFNRRTETYNKLAHIADETNFKTKQFLKENALSKMQAKALGVETEVKYKLDNSIKITSACSKKREVEMLYDHLLWSLQNDKYLSLEDILIMTPDVEAYYPYIDAVFNSSDFKQHLKFNVTDTSNTRIGSQNKLLSKTFLLNPEKISLKEISEFLESIKLRKTYSIVSFQEALDCLSGSSFVLGLGNNSENETSLIGWTQSKKRLVYGAIMSPEAYDDVEPFESSSDLICTLGTIELVDTLFTWARENSASRTFEDWFKLFAIRYETWYIEKSDEKEDFNIDEELIQEELHEQLALWEHFETLADSTTKITANTFYRILESEIAVFSKNRTRRSNGIVVSDLSSSKGLAKKKICLIGLNDGDYPMKEVLYSFDLLRADKQRPQKRETQKTDFLSAVCNAEESLYLSFVGKNSKNNKELLPSIFLCELLDQFGLDYNEENIIQHPANPGNPIYNSSKSALQSYHQLAINNSKDGFTNDLIAQNQQENESDVEESKVIYLDEIVRFFKDPSKYFLNKVLGVYLKSEEEEIPSSECFEMNHLGRWIVREEAKKEVLQEEELKTKNLKQELIAPLGGYGNAQIKAIQNEISPALQAVQNENYERAKIQEGQIQIAVSGTMYTIVANDLNYLKQGDKNCAVIVSNENSKDINNKIGKDMISSMLNGAFISILNNKPFYIETYDKDGNKKTYTIPKDSKDWFANQINTYLDLEKNPPLFFPKKSFGERFKNKPSHYNYNKLIKYLTPTKNHFVDENEAAFWEIVYQKSTLDQKSLETTAIEDWNNANKFWDLI